MDNKVTSIFKNKPVSVLKQILTPEYIARRKRIKETLDRLGKEATKRRGTNDYITTD